MDVIYTDNNATTKVAPEVLEEMLPYLTDQYGNPSSMHKFGGEVGQRVKKAREKVAGLLNASPDEILFTSCGTESDNTAVRSALATDPDKRHIVTTKVEHPAIKHLYEHLATRGYRTTFIPVDNQGMLDLKALEKALTPDTALVSVMWANNETGVVFPIDEIAQLVKSRGITFHTDAVQAMGKVPVDVSAVPVDMLSLSGHKIHAPKGVAALYVRKGTKFSPFLLGGHQEGGRRGGTENTAGVIGLGRAAELAAVHMEDMNTRVRGLRDDLQDRLMEKVENSRINGGKAPRLPNTLSIAFEFVEGESILLMMDQYGICASSGSACTSGSLEPSHVLRAMGVPFTAAHGSIRFSLSSYNTEEEMDVIVDKLPPIIRQLRELSPFWTEKTACAAQ